MKTRNRLKRVKITSVLAGLVAALALTYTQSARAQTWTRKADMPTAQAPHCPLDAG